MSCKACELEKNNPEFASALLSHSSRYIAARFEIGKSTVIKHRAKHSGLYVPKSTETKMQELEDEGQSFEWNGNTGVWKTGTTDAVLTDISPENILRQFGHNPDQVAIKGVIRESHKEYYSRDEGKMLWKHSYAYAVEKKSGVVADSIDPVELIKQLQPKFSGKSFFKEGFESTFALTWGDWQFAKKEGGGTQGLIERVNSAVADAVVRINELRSIGRKLDKLVIVGGGDMVEGCVIYPNQSYEIDGNRREQIRGTAALIIQSLATLAPMFESVKVFVVPGNHGEHRIMGNRTTIGDNDDLLVFEIAELACKNDPRFSHVEFEIAEKEISMTTKIYDWTFGATHGDVFGKGSGTGVRNKVFNWFKTMAANRHPIGASDVLLTFHFHHDAQEDWGNTLWVQSRTMDGGSHYFKEFSGHDTDPGMLSFVVTPTSRFQDKQYLA